MQVCLLKGRKSKYTQENGKLSTLLFVFPSFMPRPWHEVILRVFFLQNRLVTETIINFILAWCLSAYNCVYLDLKFRHANIHNRTVDVTGLPMERIVLDGACEVLLVSKQASAHWGHQERQHWRKMSSYLAMGSSGFMGAQLPSGSRSAMIIVSS